MAQKYKPGDLVVYELTVRFDPEALVPYDTKRTFTQVEYGVVLGVSGNELTVRMESGDEVFHLPQDKKILRKASWLERSLRKKEFPSLEGALQP